MSVVNKPIPKQKSDSIGAFKIVLVPPSISSSFFLSHFSLVREAESARLASAFPWEELVGRLEWTHSHQGAFTPIAGLVDRVSKLAVNLAGMTNIVKHLDSLIF